MVEKTKIMDDEYIICYKNEDEGMLNKKYPSLKLALGFNDEASIEKIRNAGIPFKNLLALTPQKLQEESFYKKIHEMGILTSVGSYGNVDTLPPALSYKAYKKILKT